MKPNQKEGVQPMCVRVTQSLFPLAGATLTVHLHGIGQLYPGNPGTSYVNALIQSLDCYLSHKGGDEHSRRYCILARSIKGT